MKGIKAVLVGVGLISAFSACGGGKDLFVCDGTGCLATTDESVGNCRCDKDGNQVKNCEDSDKKSFCPLAGLMVNSAALIVGDDNVTDQD